MDGLSVKDAPSLSELHLLVAHLDLVIIAFNLLSLLTRALSLLIPIISHLRPLQKLCSISFSHQHFIDYSV